MSLSRGQLHFQEGEDDEDITPLDVPTDPPTVMHGPMTRARIRNSI